MVCPKLGFYVPIDAKFCQLRSDTGAVILHHNGSSSYVGVWKLRARVAYILKFRVGVLVGARLHCDQTAGV